MFHQPLTLFDYTMMETLYQEQFFFPAPPPKCLLTFGYEIDVEEKILPSSFLTLNAAFLMYMLSSKINRFLDHVDQNIFWVMWKGIIVGILSVDFNYKFPLTEKEYIKKRQVINIDYVYVQNKWRRKGVLAFMSSEFVKYLLANIKVDAVVRFQVDNVLHQYVGDVVKVVCEGSDMVKFEKTYSHVYFIKFNNSF